MAQRQKDEVRERILAAALALFARHGYRKTTMAAIAAEADVATGNLYRYYENKDELFAAVVPDAFVQELISLMSGKVRALDGVDDIRTLPAEAAYHRMSAELLDFCIENRQHMIILIVGADGSHLDGVVERVVKLLKSLALEHFRSVSPAFSMSRAQRVNLDLAYRNFIRSTSAILAEFRRDADAREALKVCTQYHLSGLRGMFESSFV